MRRKLASLVAAALVTLAILPASANAYVYWGDGPFEIGRANLDGTGVNQNFISTGYYAYGVAVDAGHVYWTNDRLGHDRPRQPRRHGRRPELHHRGRLPGGRRGRRRPRLLDEQRRGHDRPRQPRRHGRRTRASSPAPPARAASRSTPATSTGRTSTRDTIGRANLDGTGVDQSFITGASVPDGRRGRRQPRLLGQLHAADTIGRANLDGSGVDQSFITGAAIPDGVAVDADHVYWANGTASTIGRANLDGTGVDQSFITGVAQGVAVDSLTSTGPPPNTTITSGPSGTTTDPTPTFTFSSSEPGSTFQCALGSGPYAACTSPKTTSRLTHGAHAFYVRATKNGAIDPTPAHRTFTVATAPSGTVSVSVQNTALVVAAGPGASDNIAITRPSRFTVRVTDFPAGDAYTGSVVHAGPGCTRSGDHAANCPASGITPVLPVLVTSAGQPDRVVNSSGLPSSLYGGSGDDLLVGGSDRDVLRGGAGRRRDAGDGGNDLLRAHDGASDETINCGGGSGDKADLDLLPLDPAPWSRAARPRRGTDPV